MPASTRKACVNGSLGELKDLSGPTFIILARSCPPAAPARSIAMRYATRYCGFRRPAGSRSAIDRDGGPAVWPCCAQTHSQDCAFFKDQSAARREQEFGRGLVPRLSRGILQLSIRCSSIHFLPSRSFPSALRVNPEKARTLAARGIPWLHRHRFAASPVRGSRATRQGRATRTKRASV